jgi:hypothetical protein
LALKKISAGRRPVRAMRPMVDALVVASVQSAGFFGLKKVVYLP